MVLSDLLRQSLRNIASHKRRNLFSAFGVTWGVASILLLAGWGVGVQHYMREGMESFGKDIIVVFQGHTSKGIGGYRAGRVILLYPEDVEAIRAYSSKVKVVVPVDQFDLAVSRNNISESRRVRGVVPEARTMRNLTPERGRFFTMDDIENRRRVCVLGSDVRDRYFKPDEDPLGKEIRIGGITFTVVGVLPEKEQMVSMGGRDKDLIFIPFSTGRRLFAGRRPLFCIMARSFRPEQDEETVVEIRKALAIKHNFSPDDEEAVWVIPLTKYTKLATTSARAIGIFVAGVGILTLAIGSVGVTNMMLVSVSERIEEIGIRRATGATKYNIIWQFLTETLLLTVIAGGIGFCLGMALLWLVTRLPIPDYIPTPSVSVNGAVVAIIVMVIAGVLAGITPARRAAAIAAADAITGNVRAWSPKRS
ncbi:MAG TPA: FtsX-like permease family protein, partial [Firmicutes bacterium]|nr:FtsX-like permease family protein [Bacillota bacterium]